MGLESEILQTLLKGGTAGLVVLLVAYTAWKDNMYNKTINRHLHELTQVLGGVQEVLKDTKVTIEKNTTAVEENGRMLDRMRGFIKGRGLNGNV